MAITMKDKKKREKLSIYLAKTGEIPDHLLVKLENSKPAENLKILEGTATLYVKKDAVKKVPSWANFLIKNQNLPEDLFGQGNTVGAALVVRIGGNTFLLTFGFGFHLLKSDYIARDFGLKVTLNSIDPEKLRSLDKSNYDDNPLNSRNQSSKDVGIFDLDIDSETDMLYAITGLSTVPIFGTHVTGRDALTIHPEADLLDLPAILNESLARYRKKLPENFEWVDNIYKIKDSETNEILDLVLDEQLSGKTEGDFWLGEPEIVDWETQIGYSFDLYSNSPRVPTLSVQHVEAHLHSRGEILSVSSLKTQAIHINNADHQPIKSWSAYRCLYAEINYSSEQYILRNGIWYKINNDFIERIDNYLEDIMPYEHDLMEYNHDNEGDYNLAVAKLDPTYESLDKKNISYGGPHDKIEFCDLIKDKIDFIHVKYYRSSSTLSHLFSQGCVAAEAFVSDKDFRRKLIQKLPGTLTLNNTIDRPDAATYSVVYAIAVNRQVPSKLPFFSKVTLKNALKRLRALGFNVKIASIPVSKELLIKKKYKCSR